MSGVYSDSRITVLPGRQVLVNGHTAKLSPYEFRILAFLLVNPGMVSRRDLVERVWPGESEDPDLCRTRIGQLKTYVNRLNIKARNSSGPDLIENVRGEGYFYRA